MPPNQLQIHPEGTRLSITANSLAQALGIINAIASWQLFTYTPNIGRKWPRIC